MKDYERSTERVYLDFKKGRTERGPLVDDPEEGKFGLFSALSRVLVEQRHDGLRGKHTDHIILDFVKKFHFNLC